MTKTADQLRAEYANRVNALQVDLRQVIDRHDQSPGLALDAILNLYVRVALASAPVGEVVECLRSLSDMVLANGNELQRRFALERPPSIH